MSSIAPLPPARPAAPGRPKDMEKAGAILEAARRLFTAHGFDGASMDQIAAEAGVSKLTVYSHYGDKDTLFAAVVKSYCEQNLPDSLFESAPDMPIRERLMQVGRVFFAFVSSPEAVAGHRMLCSPRMADSPLPGKFWEAGPARVQRVFADLLRRRANRGELEIEDPTLAARQFLTLLKGELHTRMVLGCCGHCDDPEGHVAASVDFFLRAYAPRDGR
ncbi:TetR/AcrR family transcriptional regulator [Cognatiluteimonas lumbrici]|uniref:TetR/AcrR family transcriptional regulator n=1 Tax=Cognatiluteimonas lumbrici TaxID=2559601 RepID=UPI00112945D8|nr:TetR/AcrR family transcriptional regulator [Luteimonas lumbrici]